jgi:hypothetical protein
MAVITAPDFDIRHIDWSPDRPSQSNADWQGKRKVAANPWFEKWRAHLDLVPIVGEDNVRPLRSFFARCDGPVNRFPLRAVEGPQNANSGVTVASTAAAGATSMTLAGAATALKDGQLITVNGQLLQLVADQSGSTVNFEPQLRAQASAGAAVETSLPYATVFLATPPTWSVAAGKIYSISFDVEEAF